MILEGFEIENWSCIKRVVVDGLPPTGLAVLHGPNGTGKSSILAALRACLMDYAATSTDKRLKRWFPKNSTAKPRVSVTFRAQGSVWRITKQFGSKESKLESRSAADAWKVVQSTAAEAHEHTRRLAGNKDSYAGLQQLLWLTQTEFHLPDPKRFDSDVQAQLRFVLGILQTPLDDQFLRRTQEQWSRWFGARSKPGEKPKLKKDCPLDKALTLLEKHKGELAGIETQYREFESKMQRAEQLQVRVRDLGRQLNERTPARDLLQDEYDRSKHRLELHRGAVKDVDVKERAFTAALALRQRRLDAEKVCGTTEREAEAARRQAAEKTRQLKAAEQRLRELRDEIQIMAEAGRNLQSRRNAVTERLQLLSLQEQVKTAREKRDQAEKAHDGLGELKRQSRELPAPDAATLKKFEKNRTNADRLRAELDAAAITLTLIPDPGALAPRVAIDGMPPPDAAPLEDGSSIRRSIRRRAEIGLPGWGRAEVARGSDTRSLDQIENDLIELDRQFADGLAPFGLASDATVLDQLRRSAADKIVREAEMERNEGEIDRLAPQGLDHLREEIAGLEKRLQAGELAMASTPAGNDLPAEADEREQLGKSLRDEIDAKQTRIDAHKQQAEEVESEVEGTPHVDGAVVKKGRKTDRDVVPGLRQQESSAKETLAGLSATVELRRGELDRMLTAEQIDQEVQNAEKAVDDARKQLEATRLTENEETIRERLDAAEEGLRVLSGQLGDAQKELHQIQGAMTQSEGLHQKRAAAAARVEELAAQTERERLESEAFDRLYGLFEECREKRLGAVMGPIHDRVLRWMRLLRIGGYRSIGFNDQFLPEKLVSGDGASETMLDEESTGTIEQIALMVRLALGATLSTPAEPVVAMLDDPLTHSDVVRLDLMRAILKSASVGDTSSTPPAGPLQIVVFTCHPEWFGIDGARIVDLSKPDVLNRSCD
jgi:hypothetical protein